ncbi:hypothetical protein [Streptomyces sp. NRRL S-1813]|uniref:hypothetical protein n=1 Tax=Streptomyces sp. NRRL S-1813 TaxID=1463888 RepID=UPI0004C618D0|nr:hypothetical protein [Streptomyces sp. NRRL S-1813]
MAEGTSTAQARVNRWQTMLSGTGLHEVGGAALRRSGPVNLLSGVWLHAAARAEQGLELTELERSLLAPLSKVLGEEEVHAIGRVHREQQASGQAGILPQVITSRSLKEGFDFQDYRAALTGLLPQITGAPNVSLADPAALSAGEGVTDPGFAAAVGEYGYGLTAFTGGEREGGARTLSAYRARLEWDGFICHEAVGDQGGGRDEIYWTCASNARNYAYTTRTKETGSVTGNRQWYPIWGDHVTGSRVFFDTTLDGCGAALITLWEADQSNSEWYDALGRALNDVVNTMSIPDMYLGLFPGTDLIGHMNTALSFFATFWEAFRNKDDQVLPVGFTFGAYDLSTYYGRPEGRHSISFNAQSKGMGMFTLNIRYTGDQPQM